MNDKFGTIKRCNECRQSWEADMSSLREGLRDEAATPYTDDDLIRVRGLLDVHSHLINLKRMFATIDKMAAEIVSLRAEVSAVGTLLSEADEDQFQLTCQLRALRPLAEHADDMAYHIAFSWDLGPYQTGTEVGWHAPGVLARNKRVLELLGFGG